MAQASSHRSPQLRPRTAALHICRVRVMQASPPSDTGLHGSFDSSVQIIQEDLAFAAAHGRCRLELVHPLSACSCATLCGKMRCATLTPDLQNPHLFPSGS